MGGEQISCCQGFGVREGLTTKEQHERKFGGAELLSNLSVMVLT